jgi:cysteinyl-tRNA synthetase
MIRHVRAFFDEIGETLGLFHHPPAAVVEVVVEGARQRLFPAGSQALAEVEALVAARGEARLARDFERADSLRQRLIALGVEVRDTRDGSLWRPALHESCAD